MYEELINSVRDRKVIPFIGAGFSRNLNLPSWDDVIDIIAKHIGWSPEVLKIQGDFYQIAEFYTLKKSGISELRSVLDILFHNSNIDITKSDIHSLLIQLNAPIIYTTNWDSWIEKAFESANKPYHVVRNLADIAKIKSEHTQIIKFHGDFKGRDEDLVFTESSFFKRLDFNSALDIKLRSDILGKSLLFIGYSFNDINIRYLWYQMTSLLEKLVKESRDEYPCSYIVSVKPNELQNKLFENKYIKVIHLGGINFYDELKYFLRILSKEDG